MKDDNMEKRFIEKIDAGVMNISDGSKALVVSIRYTENNTIKWFVAREKKDAILEFWNPQKDIFNQIMQDELPDDVEEIHEFDEVELFSYWDIYKTYEKKPALPRNAMVNLMVGILRCEYDQRDSFIKSAENKYADDIHVPTIDLDLMLIDELP